MNNSLSELINHATQCLIDLGLSPETIKCYQCSAFHPLERKLENQKNISSSMLMEQEGYFGKQFQEGKISRQTYNWRIRGIRILAEVCDTGRFTWKIYSKKEKISLPEPFSSVLYSFKRHWDGSLSCTLSRTIILAFGQKKSARTGTAD